MQKAKGKQLEPSVWIGLACCLRRTGSYLAQALEPIGKASIAFAAKAGADKGAM
jgi:hypothetical protein